MRYIVIGDIHGESVKLTALLASKDFKDRRAIFAGDYINRGPNSRLVVDKLIEVRDSSRDSPVFLRGNHEEMLLRWLTGGPRDDFLKFGGLPTVKSYTNDRQPGVLTRFVNDFPPSHFEFLSQTQLYFEDNSMLASHAGFDPSRPKIRDIETMVFGQRNVRLTADNARSALASNQLAIFGHYVQTSRTPLLDDPLYCIDTGCGTVEDGRLSALLMPERVIVQF